MYLIKIGEIALKAGNRKIFERQLKDNVLKFFPKDTDYFGNNGRFYLSSRRSSNEQVESRLSKVFGITGFAPVWRCGKSMEEIGKTVLALMDNALSKSPGIGSFKIESRRSDKGFPLNSYELSCTLGDLVLNSFPELRVDCSTPDLTVHCEIREKAVVFGDAQPGLGGLPVGSAGRGTLLLSGGIDSPVAGYLMAKRGLHLDAVYFHTPPFTSDKALEKVETLASRLAPYCSGIKLFTVPFTETQLHIKKYSKEEETTLLMRACMMKIAEQIGRKKGSKCLVTGEALSQVASQTVESLTFTGSSTDLPVFRPLIGYDKEEIVKIAREIDTFDTSILPYDDCCTLFSPSRPIVRPKLEKMRSAYEKLAIDDVLSDAAENSEMKYFRPENL